MPFQLQAESPAGERSLLGDQFERQGVREEGVGFARDRCLDTRRELQQIGGGAPQPGRGQLRVDAPVVRQDTAPRMTTSGVSLTAPGPRPERRHETRCGCRPTPLARSTTGTAGTPRPTVPGHEVPAATRNQHVQKDRVEDQPVAVLQRPSAPGQIAHRQVHRHDLPHGVGQGTRAISADVIPARVVSRHRLTTPAGMTHSHQSTRRCRHIR